MFTRAHHSSLPWVTWIQSTLSHYTLLLILSDTLYFYRCI